jgi:hypothetical protein
LTIYRLSKDKQISEVDHESMDGVIDEDDLLQESDPGEYVCLLIFQLGRISLCMIVDLKCALNGTTISQMVRISC